MSPVLREVRALTRLAIPVALAQLASMMLWVVDLLMIGRVSVEALDAASLARSWVLVSLIFGMGMIFGIDPIVSQAFGARDRIQMSLSVQWGLVTAGAMSLLVGAIWALTEPSLKLLGQDPELSRQAHAYVLVQLPGMPFFLAFMALRQWLQGRGIMRPAMWISVAANFVNFAANWVLIFGKLGFPALGLVGAGIATAMTEVFMFAALLACVLRYRLHRGAWAGWSREALAPRPLLRVAGYGFPVALQITLELLAFSLSTFLAGLLGHTALASHTVAINLASVTFMVPLGVGIASVTRIGNLVGAREPQRAQLASWVAIGFGAFLALIWAAIFYFGREWLPRLYTEDAAVIALCAVVLPIAAAFQVSDAVQVVGAGILRGMGRTVPAAVFNFLGYYVFALPLAWWLIVVRGGGLEGLWWAMFAGLTAVAFLMVVWIQRRGPGTLRL